MYKSLLLLSAFLLSFVHQVFAQCPITITASNTTTCVGQPLTLTATPGALSYTWYDPANNVIGTSQSVTTVFNTTGTVQYTCEAVFSSCTDIGSISITYLPAITIVANSNSPVPLGGNLNLTVTFTPGSTYNWIGPNFYNSTFQNPVIPMFTCTNAGTYTVTVTNTNGCTATDMVNVIQTGQSQVVGSNNGPVCTGDLLQLSANTITGATYTWTGPNGYTSTQQNPSFTVSGPVDAGIYTVAANENGCVSTDTTLVLICNTIFVTNYIDGNNNCIYDSGFDNLLSQPVETQIDSNGVIIDTISSTGGFYYAPFGSAGDIYTFTTLSLPSSVIMSCPVTGIVSHTLTTSGMTYIDMGVTCSNFTDYDLAISASNPASGAIWQNGYIYATNNYCSSIPATVSLTHSPKYQYFFAIPSPTTISGNVLTWDINSLSNSGLPYTIYYSLHSNPLPLISGDTVHSYFTISPTNSDLNPANNEYFIIDTVVASLDPNAITAFPATCVQAGTKMQYTIEFENVGNSPAENIYVLDTLPADLEANTMKLIMSSHNMFVTKIQDGGYNILRFDFPNINLPDSSDHAGCHGQLVYSIDLNSALPYGAEVYHKAGIYFDYNAVVMTNNELTTICIPQNVTTTAKDGSTMLYPNPAGDELTLQTDGTFTGYTITNSIGQTMQEQTLSGKQTKLNISSLAPGLYYINITGADSNEVLKFVKK